MTLILGKTLTDTAGSLRVVLSLMTLIPKSISEKLQKGLRVVLSLMTLIHIAVARNVALTFESSVIYSAMDILCI